MVSRLLGTLFANHLKKLPHDIDYLVPVPLHRKRLKQRGFNQALEISREIYRNLNIPIHLNACQRVRYTEPQTDTSFEFRNQNVKHAFESDRSIQNKSIAIIDDVMTSGHTVNEMAKALRKGGAKKIVVWVVARAGKE
jgi:ComF family protein